MERIVMINFDSTLTWRGTKLYEYLKTFKDKEGFCINADNDGSRARLSKFSFDVARRELIQKGYLKQNENRSYNFYPKN